ncbi:uncharacterized protein LOC111272405 [Varroa jacobsoni]|uniref:uncharacterized protein LOC111272405 n=1 Tax=Varroa jacobsoni TaxID=62625 RepID=UPI000BF261C8|nr:uncharacterized protein LOC111272405 [Varroa jacobsoni]
MDTPIICKPSRFASANAESLKTSVYAGRSGKYYDLMFVDSVAHEVPIQRRVPHHYLQDQPAPARRRDSSAEPEAAVKVASMIQVLETQDPQNSRLYPQPSVRRRRSRQGSLVGRPTPPVRRLRPGSLRSKESTPGCESPSVSTSEDPLRSSVQTTQPSLDVVVEHDIFDTKVIYHRMPPSEPVLEAKTVRNMQRTEIPIYDQPRRIKLVDMEKETENIITQAREHLSVQVVNAQKPSRTPSPNRVPLLMTPVDAPIHSIETQRKSSPKTEIIPVVELPVVVQKSTSEPLPYVNPSGPQITVPLSAVPKAPNKSPQPVVKTQSQSSAKRQINKIDSTTVEPILSEEKGWPQQEEQAPTQMLQESFKLQFSMPLANATPHMQAEKSQSAQQSSQQPLLLQQQSPNRLPTPHVSVDRIPSPKTPSNSAVKGENAHDTSRLASSATAPIVHREVLDESHLGTISPESLKDWYDDENYPCNEDNEDQPIKRKPSKIMRKIQGLFEKKKPDEEPTNENTERRRSDQLEISLSLSAREPTTPTKKSKFGQFFSFNRKDEKQKHTLPSEIVGPALQGPVDIPQGMLAKVFINRLSEEKQTRIRTHSCAPPVIDFRDWSPSTEDLTTTERGKSAKIRSPPKTSIYYVPEIPPFQPKSAPLDNTAVTSEHAHKGDLEATGLKTFGPPEWPLEAQNSPYSSCRDRANAKTTVFRRTSLASDDVSAMYEEFFDKEQRGILLEEATTTAALSAHELTSKSGFTRKLSTKAAAIPPELRAPLYRPPSIEESLTKPRIAQAEIKSHGKESQSDVQQPAPLPTETAPSNRVDGQEETPFGDEEGEAGLSRRERRNVVRELRIVFSNALHLIQLMVQDLLDGIPKQVWQELRIVLVILTAMLLGLYFRGMVRFNGTSFADLLRAFFRGLRVLLGMIIRGGLTLYDTIDSMLSDASTNLVADTLKEI